MSVEEQYNELAFYTLSHKSSEFIHQHIVDAFALQTANETTKPIKIVFSLAGIYLLVEKKYTGKQVQLAHIEMTKKSKIFPAILLPENRGKITISDVLKTADGNEKDQKINEWCVSVWNAFSTQHHTIISLTDNLLK